MYQATIRELSTFTDWARDKLFELASGLTDEQLDRPFEMGIGSIRNTLHHIWAAERVWLDRWTIGGQPKFIFPEAGLPLDELLDRSRATAKEREQHLARLSDAELARDLAFTNIKGETYCLPLGGQMTHVSNHGIHHRSQAVNMLRHVGVSMPQRGLDYIFYRLEQPATPALELAAIRDYQRYADWGTRKLIGIAAGLGDAQLDRGFKMGMGSLRKTFAHLLAAEDWWQGNWSGTPVGEFPELDAGITISELSRCLDEVWKKRAAFVAGLEDSDLVRPVHVQPRPDLNLSFPLGVTLVQLCGHATHHRAQALNMLRHVGAETPGLDLILWLRDSQPARA